MSDQHQQRDESQLSDDVEEDTTSDEELPWEERPFTVPGIPDIVLDSFDSKNVYQVVPDVSSIFAETLGDLLKGLAATTGTDVAMAAAILPGLFSGCIGPGLVITPYQGSSWRQKVMFWVAVKAKSGAGECTAIHQTCNPLLTSVSCQGQKQVLLSKLCH